MRERRNRLSKLTSDGHAFFHLSKIAREKTEISMSSKPLSMYVLPQGPLPHHNR